MNKKRNRYIDILKGILILIVVFRHIFQVSAENSDTDYICNLMAIVEMPLFIAISGYFCVPNILTNTLDFNPVNKIKKISISYLIPFLSYFMIFRLFFYRTYDGISSITAIFHNISLSLWYLFAIWMLNIFSIISYVIVTKIIRKHQLLIAAYIASYLLCIGLFLGVGITTDINFLGCKLIVYYSLFYLIGYLAKIYPVLIQKANNKWLICLCYAIYFLAGNIVKVMAVPDTIIFIAIRFSLAIVGIVVVLHLTNIIYQNYKCKLIEKIGIMTLEVYYIHSFLLNVLNLNKAAQLMSLYGLINVTVVSIFIGIICPFLIFIIKSNSIVNFLIFGKKEVIEEKHIKE